ncbi:GGDEF domain-containing protein [Alteromonas sp. 1_MG-2023]|uniref:GGDEF domain-containing protein n=1 Tax=Alteromonas sp. 1_MG-2023 TaxID=3062669 RepID=UPI0026FD6400|nr:GGDEF domain-containing protein [Alteromonas sp. 1_MG-2023]
MDSKQLSSLASHNETLVQFIIRLSSFYEGLSAETDKELRVLRGHLSGKPDFTLATVSINKLNTHIQHADTSVKQHTQLTVKELEKAIKQFQSTFQQNKTLRQQSAHLLITAQQPVDNLFQLQSLCLKAIKLFSLVSAEAVEENAGASPRLHKKPEARTSGSLFEEIQNELSQLIDSYAKKQPDEPKVVDLRTKLESQLSEEELLQTCIIVIRLVVTESMHEATLSGRMIYRIHHALGGIQEGVEASMASSGKAFEARNASADDIASQLTEMGQTVQDSDSLEKLKTQAQAHITSISTAVANRKEADNMEQQALMGLLSAMQTQMETLQRQTQVYRRKLAEQTAFSHTDPLTRLPNRLAYNERFNREYEDALNDNRALSLAVIDIDFFKSINDRFGHQAGDKTLQVVGHHLKKQLHGDEFISRWGGEEFVMILPFIETSALEKKLDDMRESLSRLPFKFKQEKVSITASFGGTCLRENDEPHSMFERADELLYQAKKNGRNRVVVE